MRYRSPSESVLSRALRGRISVAEVVEDALACVGNRGRQFLLDELVLVVVTLAC